MNNDILCITCIHRNVCKNQEKFRAAHVAINDATVHYGENSMIRLRDIPWIKYGLACQDYYKEVSVR